MKTPNEAESTKAIKPGQNIISENVDLHPALIKHRVQGPAGMYDVYV